jgi:hypothetical protein
MRMGEGFESQNTPERCQEVFRVSVAYVLVPGLCNAAAPAGLASVDYGTQGKANIISGEE